ncbi:hypothetical protein D9M73_170540 [compost metagenome]
MLRQTPVQLALQYQLSILARQPCGNSRHFTRIGGPVLATLAVAATDGLLQPAVPIEQADRHAIHLRLHPEVTASLEPLLHGGGVGQLVEPGVGDGMAYVAGAAVQRGGECWRLLRETGAPLLEAAAGLVVELVGDG